MRALGTFLMAAVIAGPAFAAEIDLENLDNGTPYHDRLAFSRINGGVTTHVFHDTVVLRIKNLSGTPLTISSLAISGGDSTYFTLPNGELTTPPAPIAAGGQYDLTVKFQAGTSPGTKAKRESTLVITSNDADEGTLAVQIAGYNLAQPEGNNEPSLQELLDVFGYATRITYAGQVLNQQGLVRRVGDEVLSPYWQRADTSLPVTMIQLAAFHSQGNTATFRWFNKGSGSQTTVATMAGVEAQSILPHRNGSTTLLTTGSFTPSGSVFGFAVDGERSDPALNSQTADQTNGCPGPCGHHVRVWAVRDRSGKLIPNTYVLSMDYSGINYDYNDNTYLLTNIRPELVEVDPNIPARFPGSPDLVREFNQAYAGTLVDAQGETTGFADTQRNKNDNTVLPPPVASYDAAALDINTGGAGTLTIATNAGSNSSNDNTLVNGLCLPFDGRGQVPFRVTTTILGPITNLATANQQGGVMFGPDQDNFVKLVAIGQSGNPVLQLHAEQNGTGANVGATVAIANAANVTSLVLTLVGDPRDGTVRGSYTLNYSVGSPVSGQMPGVLTLTGTQRSRFFDRRVPGCLITMHKNATQVQVVFDRFAIASGESTDVRPSLARLNVGGPAYTDSGSNAWTPDTGLFTPSTVPAEGGAAIAVANTVDDNLYYTYRGNMGSIPQAQRVVTFNIPVGAATLVDVRVHFAELFFGAPGGGASGPVRRIMDILVEGQTAFDDFDINAASGAARTAVIVPIEKIAVTDGTLNLGIKADLNQPSVSAIEVLVSAPECAVAADCSGTAGVCQQIACVVGQCILQNLPAGTTCTSDGNACTDDQCNGSGACLHPNNAAPCDDGIFCNGPDTCGGGSCSVHPGDPCTGGTSCTNTCNELADNCVAPAGTPCADEGNPCTDDVCTGSGNCAHLPNSNPCDDGFFCNGADTCGGGGCTVHTGNPCTGGPECADACNETADNCFDLAGAACTSDGNPCTDDQCNGSGACLHPNNTAPCNDLTFCNGPDTCAGGSCSVHAGNPCAGGGDCADTCNEAGATCFDPAGTSCTSDGNACTTDTCDGGGVCTHLVPPGTCDDSDPCTADTCSAVSGCGHAPLGGQSCDTGQPGVCAAGLTSCSGGNVTCEETTQPGEEECGTGLDEDCDGEVDDVDLCGAHCTETASSAVQTKLTKVTLKDAPDRDKLATQGTIIVPSGFDPTTSEIAVTVEDAAGSYYTATLPVGRFITKNGRAFKFKDQFAPYQDGGLRDAQFVVKADGTTVKYKFTGQALNLPSFAAGVGRVTIRVADRCWADDGDACTASAGGAKCK